MEHTTFTNRTLRFDELPQWEYVEKNRISTKYKYIVIINIVLFTLIVGGIFFGFSNLSRKNEVALETTLYIALGWTLLMIIWTIINLIALKRRGYAVREQDILYTSGILAHTTLIIPFKHIQHVEIKESFFERQFQLASIRLFTAGAGNNIQIVGIDKSDALILQDYLSKRISSRKISTLENE